MLNKICFYFLLFTIYSFVGWVIEVVGKLIEKRRFINRGFLIGPVCSIYGFGCIAMILLLTKYKNCPLLLFFMAILICSVLEYFTSYFMEKIFHVRWWDYTRKRFNLNGRICAETMVPFGLLGCLVIYVVNPAFSKIILEIPANLINIVAFIIFGLYVIDNFISISIIFGFKDTLKTFEKDGTEEITKKVKEVLLKRNLLYKRLVNAFPTFLSKKERIVLLEKNSNIIVFGKVQKKYKDVNK